MSLIKDTLSPEQKTKAALDAHLLGGANELYYRAQQVFNYVWANPQGLSAQQVFDIYADQALAFAMLFAKVETLVKLIDAEMWQLTRPGVIVPVLGEDGKPNGFVLVE